MLPVLRVVSVECPHLTSLSLHHNPLPSSSYRAALLSLLVCLRSLDGVAVRAEEKAYLQLLAATQGEEDEEREEEHTAEVEAQSRNWYAGDGWKKDTSRRHRRGFGSGSCCSCPRPAATGRQGWGCRPAGKRRADARFSLTRDQGLVPLCGESPEHSEAADQGAVKLQPDDSLGMARTEIVCSKCGSHLGHLFTDDPSSPSGQHYCINSVALEFKDQK